MQLFLDDLKRVPKMFVGFLFLSFGVVLTRLSSVGMDPWGVFHDGLREVFKNSPDLSWITFGMVIQGTGIIILLISIVLLKTKVGIGTLANAILVGSIIDFFTWILPSRVENTMVSYVVLFVGLITMTFGRALYISAELGSGPRDGLFVGLTRVTGLNVKYAKPLVELVVLLIGILLGGIFGFGTLILVVSTGYVVHFFFRLLGFDPKKKRQSDVLEYFR